MLYLYNTLTKEKEEFKPIRKGEVRMYNCGPTVYNFAHIGNLRAYVFADILRRVLEYNGYKIKQAINITDIGHLSGDADEGEDKMVKALKREGKPLTLEGMREIADIYTKAFLNDLKDLNIEMPDVMPRASEHIKEDIELIQELEKKGFAYKTSDGIYFDTSRFPDYGKLGKINLEGLKAGARVSARAEKRSPIDFTLWKFSANKLGWESPWGRGFPGWHIECSAMSRKYLGQPFDIHTGGVDHIGTHHQNEIAQSEAAFGVPLANYWLHNEFVNISSGEKMAKSGENFITLQTLKNRGIHPLAYRFYLLMVHYRSPVNFSYEALLAAQVSYFKLLVAFAKLQSNGSISSLFEKECREALGDDLGTPRVIATLWELLKSTNISDADKRATMLGVDQMLGLDIENQSKILTKELGLIADDINELAKKRDEARNAKDFKTADALRVELEKKGYVVNDTESGTIISKRITN